MPGRVWKKYINLKNLFRFKFKTTTNIVQLHLSHHMAFELHEIVCVPESIVAILTRNINHTVLK